MPILHRVIIDEKRLAAAVKRAARALAPDVVRIVYSLEPDLTGAESLFLRVVLSDGASAPIRLSSVIQRVRERVGKEIKADTLDLMTYFSFRSKFEQDEMKEPSWDA